MRKIEIVDTPNDKEYKTSGDIINLINRNGIEYVLSEYELPESFILKYIELLKTYLSVILSNVELSEGFITILLKSKYINKSDLQNLNMKTYSNLSINFIESHKKYINWNKLISYKVLSDTNFDFDKYQSIIKSKNLWYLISASDNLPISFIRKNKKKLDWKILSIVRSFTDEESKEFEEFLVKKEDVIISED